MLKLPFILVVGIASSCAIENEDESGILSLDPNYGEAPEGLTVNDVDLVKDGIIDIRDLAAVAYFHGQTTDDAGEEEVVAESCPVGQYRKAHRRTVGYHKDWVEEDIPTDSSGRRLAERHEESCAYLYPYWNSNTTPPNSTCLVACGDGHFFNKLLCRQKYEVESYSDCKNCPDIWHSTAIRKFVNYVQSESPTQCQLGEKVEIPYRFAYGEDFYSYGKVRFYITQRMSPTPPVRYVGPSLLYAAVRVLVAEDGKRVKELKVKTLKRDGSIREIFNVVYADSTRREMERYVDLNLTDGNREQLGSATLKMNLIHDRDLDGVDYYLSRTVAGTTPVRLDAASIEFVRVLERITHYSYEPTEYAVRDWATDFRSHDSHALWDTGIQIGIPSEINRNFSDAYIFGIMFEDQKHQVRYVSESGTLKMLPEEVRANYFPEDLE